MRHLVSKLGLDLPSIAWQEWVLIFLTAIFCVQVLMAVDRRSHLASDTSYGTSPYFVPPFGILGWIASHGRSIAMVALVETCGLISHGG